MSNPSRRGFLKGIGGALAIAGVAAGSATSASAAPQVGPVVVAHNVAPQGRRSRMVIKPEQLELLVAETLADLVARAAAFTAYDVTALLRHRHPGVNIMHQAVRSAVHRRMEPVVASSWYVPQMVRYQSGDAVRYVSTRA